MRMLIRFTLLAAVLGGVGFAAYVPATRYLKQRNTPEFRTEEVSRGDVVGVVNATGKIKPVETIKIGSFVSGPITDMPVEIDFNKPIAKGDLMARVDPKLYEPRVKADRAALRIREAEVLRAEAQWRQARNDENRAKALRERKNDFVSQAEMDSLRFNREQLEATVELAKASVEQAEANLENSLINFDYTYIRAPKDGIIIDRKIEPGQTLAAQFQTPELFEIGVNMKDRMHVYASVDEVDIGRIKKAERTEQPVQFTVTAYPDELFSGRIVQVRMSSLETQAVVTYPVIVETTNPELKLYPGMTADISFQIEEKKNVLRIPNAALRYFPNRRELVREEDRALLDGSAWFKDPDVEEEDDDTVLDVSADVRAAARLTRNKRHVWVQDGDKLRAIEIVTGLLDEKEGKVTELVSGELVEGQKLVTGIKRKQGGLFGG